MMMPMMPLQKRRVVLRRLGMAISSFMKMKAVGILSVILIIG
jgi:hypothetical protein